MPSVERLKRGINRLSWRILGLPGYEAKVDLAMEIDRLQKKEQRGELGEQETTELERKKERLRELIDPSIRRWRERR